MENLAWITAQFSPDCGLVLACYRDAEEHTLAAVYNCRGERVSCVASLPVQGLSLLFIDWGPGGRAVCIRTEGALHLWEFSTGAPLQTIKGLGIMHIRSITWEVPYTGALLISAWGGLFKRTAGLGAQPERCSNDATRHTSPVWGVRLAVQAEQPGRGLGFSGYDQLLLHSVQGTNLTLEHTVLPAPRRFNASSVALSADGKLLAAIVSSAPYGDKAEQHLAVVCLVSRVVRVPSPQT